MSLTEELQAELEAFRDRGGEHWVESDNAWMAYSNSADEFIPMIVQLFEGYKEAVEDIETLVTNPKLKWIKSHRKVLSKIRDGWR